MKSVVSDPGFFNSGVTKPIFIDDGKRDASNERFATFEIISASSSLNSFNKEVGRMSSGEVFDGADWINRSTSAGVVGANTVKLLAIGAGGWN